MKQMKLKKNQQKLIVVLIRQLIIRNTQKSYKYLNKWIIMKTGLRKKPIELHQLKNELPKSCKNKCMKWLWFLRKTINNKKKAK